MPFIAWSALRDKLHIDVRIIKMGINLTSKYVHCKNTDQESVEHLFYGVELASRLWRIICGALVSFNNSMYRQLFYQLLKE